MTPGPAARAQDHDADGDAADLRWPPSAADLDAISCVDVISAGGGDLHAWLRQPRPIPPSRGPDAVDAHHEPQRAAPIAARRRPGRWTFAVAASAVLAVATPTLLRTARVAETAVADPPLLSVPARATTNVAPALTTDSPSTHSLAATTGSAAERERAARAASALPRHAPGEQYPRLVVALATPGVVPALGVSPATDATVERDRRDAPPPIEVPPVIVPATLEAAAVPAPGLHDSAPMLASAIPAREVIRETPLAAEPTTHAAATEMTASAAVPAALEVASVREALSRYGAAYSRLDAAAARAVWPSVDARALGRAFAELRSQRVTFDDCDIAVDGLRARAACRGATTYVPRAGDQSPRTEARAWRFELEKSRDANWRIASANISVPRESTRAR